MQDLIRNIFITHNHYDHYVLLVRTFNVTGDLAGLENIYMYVKPNTYDYVSECRLEEIIRFLNAHMASNDCLIVSVNISKVLH